MERRTTAALVLGAALAAAGCGGAGEGEPSPQTGATAEREGALGTTAGSSDAESVADGRRLFVQAGCASCHGDDAEGTTRGPALPGHSAEQVRQQVRHPVGEMPAFSEKELSDAELDAVAAYVESLGPAGAHAEPARLSDPGVAHARLAIGAIRAGDVADALHHVEHAREAGKGADPHALDEAERALRAGRLHEAMHALEQLLGGKAKAPTARRRLHLHLALAALESHDEGEARHHLQHFVELAGGSQRARGRAALRSLRARDRHEAEHEIQALLGVGHG